MNETFFMSTVGNFTFFSCIFSESVTNQTATIAYKDKPVKIILVSQDAKSRVFGVEQFIKMRKYTAECFLLSAGNPNIWIEKIEPKWSGTIPATILYKNGENVNFQEGDFADQKALEDFIHSKL